MVGALPYSLQTSFIFDEHNFVVGHRTHLDYERELNILSYTLYFVAQKSYIEFKLEHDL